MRGTEAECGHLKRANLDYVSLFNKDFKWDSVVKFVRFCSRDVWPCSWVSGGSMHGHDGRPVNPGK